MQENSHEIKSIVIIDDKDLNYQTLGKKRKDLYVALVRMLKGFKWKCIEQCTIFFDNSENSKKEEVNIDGIKFCLIPLNFSDEQYLSVQNKLLGVLSQLEKEETLVLLDVVLTDDNKGEDNKVKAINMSLTLYNELQKNKFNVLYYSTCASDYRGRINDDKIYSSVIEMDWYDVRSSAIEIIRRACQKYN